MKSILPTHNFPQLLWVGNDINEIKINLDESILNITVILLKGQGMIILKTSEYYPNLDYGLTIETNGTKNDLIVQNLDANHDFIILLKYKYYKVFKDSIPKLIIDDEYGNYYNISTDRFTEFKFNVSVHSNKNYSIIRTYSNEDNTGNMHILYGSKEQPTQKNYEKASNLYQENIMVIPTKKSKQYFITVICQSACNGNITYYASNRSFRE
jgi:hypothetical protein